MTNNPNVLTCDFQKPGVWTTALLVAAQVNAKEIAASLLKHPDINPAERIEIRTGSWGTALLVAVGTSTG